MFLKIFEILKYIKFIDWINSDQERIILENISKCSNRNIELNGRKTQVWGGKVTENGIEDMEDLPEWLYSISESLIKSKIFSNINFPNHVLINQYNFNKGILPHKDGPLYFPRVAIISLESDTIFDFWEPNLVDKVDLIDNCKRSKPLFSILVPRLSLLVFQNECYTDLLHGISSKDEYYLKDYNIININEFPNLDNNSIIKRGFRTSLTFRFVPKRNSSI